MHIQLATGCLLLLLLLLLLKFPTITGDDFKILNSFTFTSFHSSLLPILFDLIPILFGVLPRSEVAGAAIKIGEECPIPEGEVLEWMAGWMRDGAALTITYNRQRRVGEGADVPDCWHAQVNRSARLPLNDFTCVGLF